MSHTVQNTFAEVIFIDEKAVRIIVRKRNPDNEQLTTRSFFTKSRQESLKAGMHFYRTFLETSK